MDNDATIRVAGRGPRATITLANPAARNALGLDSMVELIKALGEIGTDPSVQVVVIDHEGPAFSAGHNMKEMIDRPAEFYDRLFATCTDLMQAVHRLPQPVVAVVDGVATAAGCQLVATCDLVVATDRSQFATPGVRIGLFCSTPMVPIVRAVGRKRAMEMLLTGEAVDAATAADWGLVNRVVAPEMLDAEVDRLVDSITRFSPSTIAIGKEAFYRQDGLHEDDAYELTRTVMAANAGDETAQEGMSAFLAKRPPDWPT